MVGVLPYASPGGGSPGTPGSRSPTGSPSRWTSPEARRLSASRSPLASLEGRNVRSSPTRGQARARSTEPNIPHIRPFTSISHTSLGETMERLLGTSLEDDRLRLDMEKSNSYADFRQTINQRSYDGFNPPWVPDGRESPTDWLRHGNNIEPRSFLLPPPHGSPGTSWGKFFSVDDVISRPKPLPPVQLGEWRTMAHHGGRFSPHVPITDVYQRCKTGSLVPGPGGYGPNGTPDPSISTRGRAFENQNGGKISTSARITDADKRAKSGSKIPGPGHYNTEHLWGIYERIRTASPTLSASQIAGLQTLTTELEDSVFDQRLTMSRTVPLDTLMKLGTTRFSRMCKDSRAPAVRKIARLPKPIKKSVLKSMSPRVEDDANSDDEYQIPKSWGLSSSPIAPQVEAAHGQLVSPV